MDHHCPVVGNCVALRNFRAFVAILVWGSIAAFAHGVFCAVEAGLDGYRVIGRVLGLFSSLCSLMIAIHVGGFAGFQIRRALGNETTLEGLGQGLNPYDVGRSANCAQFFGAPLGVLWPAPNDALSGFEWALAEYRNSAAVDAAA
jgi:hypothetical protein